MKRNHKILIVVFLVQCIAAAIGGCGMKNDKERIYTRQELNNMSDQELVDLFVSKGMQVDSEFYEIMSKEKFAAFFREYYFNDLPNTRGSARSHVIYRNLKLEADRVYPLIVGEEAAASEASRKALELQGQ